jgi:hypothetical protein
MDNGNLSSIALSRSSHSEVARNRSELALERELGFGRLFVPIAVFDA